MVKNEFKAVGLLGTIMSFRMIGLFMILPIFAVAAQHLPHTTPFLIGLALGIYGLMQAILQMPMGLLSDHFGRKPIICAGLCLFILGSVVAALSHSIDGIIIGRALQGMGAIGSTLLAFVADLTRDENRTKAMAMVGMLIGTSFSVAIVLGPLFYSWWQLSGLFWITALLGLVGIVLLFTAVPQPPKIIVDANVETVPNKILNILKDKQLLRLDLCILFQHAILTAMFVAIPILLNNNLHLPHQTQVWLYLIVLVLAFFCSVPFIIIAEKRRVIKQTFIGAIAVIAFTQLILLGTQVTTLAVATLLFLFFTAFTLLEATLPSMVSKVAPLKAKGTAMGIYSTSQFLGIFVGGVLGGVTLQHFQVDGIYMLILLMSVIWLLIVLSMRQPPYLSTMVFTLPTTIEELRQRLAQLPGIAEFNIVPEEQLLYVKVDKKIVDEDKLRKLLEGSNLSGDLSAAR